MEKLLKELKQDKYGQFVLDDKKVKRNSRFTSSLDMYTFVYNDELYFYKMFSDSMQKYNYDFILSEVVNSQVFNDGFKIDTVLQKIATFKGTVGVLSKDFTIKNPNAKSFDKYLYYRDLDCTPYSLKSLKGLDCIQNSTSKFQNQLDILALAYVGTGQNDGCMLNSAVCEDKNGRLNKIITYDHCFSAPAMFTEGVLLEKYENKTFGTVLGVEHEEEGLLYFYQGLKTSPAIKSSNITNYLSMLNDLLKYNGTFDNIKSQVKEQYAISSDGYFEKLKYVLETTGEEFEKASSIRNMDYELVS